jgi:hypothetical protein
MSMTITELKSLLGNISGNSFSLPATELGIDRVSELFQAYLPLSTLIVSNPQSALATLQVGGQMTLGNAVSAPAVVTFLADPTNTSVAGINIKVSLPSLNFTAPFANFSGSVLQTLGFKSPHVLLSAGDGNLNGGSPAAFIGGALAVKGGTETKQVTLLAHIPYDTPAARAGIRDNYVFEVELGDITLADLNALTQFFPGGDFDIIPPAIPLSSSFALQHIEFVVDPA